MLGVTDIENLGRRFCTVVNTPRGIREARDNCVDATGCVALSPAWISSVVVLSHVARCAIMA